MSDRVAIRDYSDPTYRAYEVDQNRQIKEEESHRRNRKTSPKKEFAKHIPVYELRVSSGVSLEYSPYLSEIKLALLETSTDFVLFCLDQASGLKRPLFTVDRGNLTMHSDDEITETLAQVYNTKDKKKSQNKTRRLKSAY